MDKIELINNNLKIVFAVDDNNRIYYEYFGSLNVNFLKNNKFPKESTLVELLTIDENHNGNHCDKFSMTPYGINCKYVNHQTLIDNEKIEEIVITTSNDVFKVDTHFVLHKNCSSFSIFNVVENISQESKILEYVSSFYLLGFGNESNPICNDMFVHKARNSWNVEAQWIHKTFLDEGIFNGGNHVTMSRYMVSNTGSWSTNGHLPMIGVEDKNKNLLLLGQIENNGSWHIEIGDHFFNYYLSLSGPTYINNMWAKKLEPKMSFRTAQATIVLADDFEHAIQQMTLARRNIVLPSKDNNELPVIFNDFMHGVWNQQKEEDVKPLVDIAAEVGAETFCIDAGWFYKDGGWPDYLGDWNECPSNYPNGGLTQLADYIRSKGMNVGLWFEIENVGIKSPALNYLDEDCFFKLNGERIIRNNKYCLNLANKKAFDWAFDSISRAIEKYQLSYIKNDYNLSVGAGNDYGYLTPGEGLLSHNRAYIQLIQKLQEKYPHLTIENCASGGQRMDYVNLKYCPIQSTSDQEEFEFYPYIAGGILTAVTPEQAGIWSYPQNSRLKTPTTDEMVITNMVTPQIGRIHLASKLFQLSKKQIELIKEGINFYKENRQFRKNALPVFPIGTSYFYDKQVAAGISDGKTMILAVWNTDDHGKEIRIPLGKYHPVSVSVAYPKSETTDWSFKDGELVYKAQESYSARLFKILLK